MNSKSIISETPFSAFDIPPNREMPRVSSFSSEESSWRLRNDSMKSTNVIDLNRVRRQRDLKEESRWIEELEEAWAIYAEFEEIAPYLPKPVLCRIEKLCRYLLSEEDE